MRAAIVASSLWLGAQAAAAQQAPPFLEQEIVVPLSGPRLPGRLYVGINSGSIAVRGEDREDVRLVVRSPTGAGEATGTGGPKAVATSYLDLDVVEESNRVEIRSHARRPLDLEIAVPAAFDLELRIFGPSTGGVRVEDVAGLVEARTGDGPIRLTGISGSVVANSDRGDVLVVFTKIDPSQPLSITSLHGDLDLSLPADVGLTASIHSDVGSVHSEFEMEAIRLRPKPVARAGSAGGFSLRVAGLLRHEINGGGVEATFKTLTGRIDLRKAASE